MLLAPNQSVGVCQGGVCVFPFLPRSSFSSSLSYSSAVRLKTDFDDCAAVVRVFLLFQEVKANKDRKISLSSSLYPPFLIAPVMDVYRDNHSRRSVGLRKNNHMHYGRINSVGSSCTIATDATRGDGRSGLPNTLTSVPAAGGSEGLVLGGERNAAA